MFPVRCYSCGKPIGHLWEEFMEKTKNKTVNVKEVLDKMGVERYCCRQQFMGHIDSIDEIAQLKRS